MLEDFSFLNYELTCINVRILCNIILFASSKTLKKGLRTILGCGFSEAYNFLGPVALFVVRYFQSAYSDA